MDYLIIPEHEFDGPNRGWFECSEEQAEAWSIWTREDGQILDLIEMFETKFQAEEYLNSIH